jgi:hypothetical protein
MTRQPKSGFLTLSLAALVLSLAVAAAGSGRAAAAGALTKVDVYSAPAQETFVANADDEARGAANNPFGTHNGAPATNEKTDGPFAGDEALFSFDVYTTPGLRSQAGSAVYTCWYYFNKNAFCDASFQLKGGTLIAAGTLNFEGKAFALAITGGYGKYAGTTGEIQASPSGKSAQHLVFLLS